MRILRHTRGRVSSSRLPPASALSRLIRKVLQSERARWSGEVNVIFVDDAKIRRINRKFLNESGTTDVIAFRSEPFPVASRQESSADIFICVPEAERNARRLNLSLREELIRLSVHGVLHLLGYDDHKPSDRKKMWSRQEKLVGAWPKK